MKLIAITTPNFWHGEDLAICRLLDSGWTRVHIRKPSANKYQIEELIGKIPEKYRQSLSLHDHFDLAIKYGIGGVHLNQRNPLPPTDWTGLISRSCHSIEETIQHSHLDYVTLSPIFDSISKPGYKSRFSAEELKRTDLNNVYALGGVTLSRLKEIKELGFSGAAMLSEAWKTKMEILQLITHTDCGLEDALRGGCRWVQLRMKEASDSEFAEMAKKILPLCRNYGATLIFDDRVNLVNELGADGVHLGKKDMTVTEARKILGPNKIIGATANTEEDIWNAYKLGADYIGLGPFRFTTTKKGLSPILGLEGYKRIMSYCKSQDITIPVVAIGGIRLDDIKNLRQSGVDGVAISGLILNSKDKELTTKSIIDIWKN
ncbi:MAG: thiamine phosphate synthase [Muribaculaceae bacterium]|nr:thiamine phosphate synthase [Muribaculaceae bacterium]